MASWTRADGSALLSCAIVTREAAPATAEVHDRMPVILREPDVQRWLDPSVRSLDDVDEMVRHSQIDFVHHPVTTRLNAAKTDEPVLIERLPQPLTA